MGSTSAAFPIKRLMVRKIMFTSIAVAIVAMERDASDASKNAAAAKEEEKEKAEAKEKKAKDKAARRATRASLKKISVVVPSVDTLVYSDKNDTAQCRRGSTASSASVVSSVSYVLIDI